MCGGSSAEPGSGDSPPDSSPRLVRAFGSPLSGPWIAAYDRAMSIDAATAPTLATLHDLARQAMEALPQPFADKARAVRLRVEEFPDDTMLADLGLEDGYDLTGLYEGTPLTQKSVLDVATEPDTIWLFRRPILEEWIDREDVTLATLVTHIVVHELAHHFGWSDDDIAAIDPWWE